MFEVEFGARTEVCVSHLGKKGQSRGGRTRFKSDSEIKSSTQ